MSWNGNIVIDMDAHVRERADKFFKDSIQSTTTTGYARSRPISRLHG
jgi:hypothetical protein